MNLDVVRCIGGKRELKACPECGRVWVYHCYHGGRQIRSVWMDQTEARRLIDR